MPHPPLARLLGRLRRLVGGGPVEEASDGQLLERFVNRRDESAFVALMERHGPLVLGVCRRMLGDAHDVDDAFQATFVVLVRRAGSLDRSRSLGNWLYGVAQRVALKARSTTARRRARERQSDMSLSSADDLPNSDTPDPASLANWSEVRAVLDDEVSRLPEKYRAPLVLCCLEGRTSEQAAAELGCPVGSMSWKLEKARELLRKRLSGRGVAAPTALIGSLMLAESARAVPQALAQATLQTALQAAAGAALAAPVAALADSVLHALWVAKVRIAAAVLVGVTVLSAGAGTWAYQALASRDQTQTTEKTFEQVDRRVLEWQPTADERKIDLIGWAADVPDALRLARELNRPVFLFNHSGRIETGRSGGSAFNMRGFALKNEDVIRVLNERFVPVYVSNAGEGQAGTATPAEQEEVQRLYREAINAKMWTGSDCVYLLRPDGTVLDTVPMRTAKKAELLAERLTQAADNLQVAAGSPAALPRRLSVPPPAGPDDLVLHLVARTFGKSGWHFHPSEDWIVVPKEEWSRMLPVRLESLTYEIPRDLAEKLLSRFYPQTENNDLRSNRIDIGSLRATPIAGEGKLRRVRLDGELRMKHAFYPTRADDNFIDAAVVGYLDYDPQTRRIVSFRLTTEQATYGGYPFGVAVRSVP